MVYKPCKVGELTQIITVKFSSYDPSKQYRAVQIKLQLTDSPDTSPNHRDNIATMVQWFIIFIESRNQQIWDRSILGPKLGE